MSYLFSLLFVTVTGTLIDIFCELWSLLMSPKHRQTLFVAVLALMTCSAVTYAQCWIGSYIDTDCDGLSDLTEGREGTDPLNPDTDGDGLTDYEEVEIYPTDPLNPDTDADGLTDGDEINIHGTDPRKADSDNDGLSDSEEIDTYGTDPLWWDTDNDFLSDGLEVNVYGSDPFNSDSDGDGLNDEFEALQIGTDPTNPDTDGDGLSDGEEYNGVHGSYTNARNPDSDGDGLTDGEEVLTHHTNPNSQDSDFDQLSDYEEVITYGTNPNNTDTDDDGLPDYHEIFVYFTNPLMGDADEDGANDGVEIANGTDPDDPDSDDDDLLDGWELIGIPYAVGDGPTLFYRLNANPLKPDLFVEVDVMSLINFSSQASNKVKYAFSQAPIYNKFGFRTGVTLHLDIHEEEGFGHASTTATPRGVDGRSAWPSDAGSLKEQLFGSALERDTPEMLEAKAKAYRYCLMYYKSSTNVKGIAELGGDDFVVFANGDGDEKLAATFMHELGHTLGLDHGGDDSIQGKPNYPSIMNYVLSYRRTWNDAFWKLDYSRAGPEALGTLNELSLDETRGIGTSAGRYYDYLMPYGVWKPTGDGGYFRKVEYVKLNGSDTDFGNAEGTGVQDGLYHESVIQDLNYVVDLSLGINLPTPGLNTALSGYDDWSNIILKVKSGGGNYSGLQASDEITEDQIEWMDNNFPLPLAECPADTNGDGILDNGDITTFITLFLAGDPAADMNADAFLDNGDIIEFITLFLAGC